MPIETKQYSPSSRVSYGSDLYRSLRPAEDYGAATLTSQLLSFGLRKNEAQLYLYLLGKDPIPVKLISRETGLHRVDVYRSLRELEQLGLVELLLGSPKRYASVNPSAAMSALMSKIESKVQVLRDAGPMLQSKLETYQRINHGSIPSVNDVFNPSSYRLVVGRARYYQEIKKLVRNAKSEVLRIVSANGLRRTFTSGLYKDYLSVKKRGVSVKMISEVNSNNIRYARRISKLLELRHLDSLHLRFVVVDRSATVLSARFDENDMSLRTAADDYLIIDDKRFAEAACFIFQHLWNVATDWEKVAVVSKSG